MTSVEPNCSAWGYQWSPWMMPGGQMVNGASTYAQSVGEKANKNERIGLASDEHSEASSSTSNNSDDCGESMNGSPLIALGSSSPSKKRRWEESEEALAAIALLAVFHDSINNSNSNSSMMDAKKSRRGRPPKGSAAATCAAAALMEEEEGEEEEEEDLEEDLEDEFEEEYEEEGSHSSSSSDGDTVPRYNKVKGENDPSYRASVGKKGSRKNSNGESNAERRARGGKTNRTATQRWTQDEHRLFRMGLARYGKGNWRRISSELLPHRTPAQVGSHAQKYFRYLERKDNMSVKDSKRWSIFSVKYSEEELLNGRM